MAQPDLFTDRGAVFSDCGRYRTLLWRRWDPSVRPANFLLLNPSTESLTPGFITIHGESAASRA